MNWRFRGNDPEEIAPLRREIVDHLRRRASIDADFDGAAVVIGELLANVVRHAPGPASVHLDWSGTRPCIEVRDGGPGFDYSPHLPSPISRPGGGRGLYLVSKLARTVAVSAAPGGGALVRAELAMTRATP